MALDIKVEAAKLREMYAASPKLNKFHGLIIGEKGAGKTSLISTFPAPILVHSFDPSGSIVLKDAIKTGRVIVDARYEQDDLYHPTAYLKWEDEFNRLGSGGFFDSLGTYVLDSTTTFANSVIWQIMKKEGRIPASMRAQTDDKKQGMRIQDWGTVLNLLIMLSRQLSNLPCHTVMLGHISKEKDEVTQEFVNLIALPGKAQTQVPVNLPELLVLRAKEAAGKIERTLLTQDSGAYRAVSRMAAGGKLLPVEPSDLKAILKKVGYDFEDKELI